MRITLQNIHPVPTRNPKKVRVSALVPDCEVNGDALYHAITGEGTSMASAIRNAERNAVAFVASLG